MRLRLESLLPCRFRGPFACCHPLPTRSEPPTRDIDLYRPCPRATKGGGLRNPVLECFCTAPRIGRLQRCRQEEWAEGTGSAVWRCVNTRRMDTGNWLGQCSDEGEEVYGSEYL